MNNLIKLAEAMGYRPTSDGGWDGAIRKHTGEHWTGPLTHISKFDPFTDANADYAVLEWSRGNDWTETQQKLFHSYLGHSTIYLIGDYAKAALKVINDE